MEVTGTWSAGPWSQLNTCGNLVGDDARTLTMTWGISDEVDLLSIDSEESLAKLQINGNVDYPPFGYNIQFTQGDVKFLKVLIDQSRVGGPENCFIGALITNLNVCF